MALCKGLGDFGVPPDRIEDAADIVVEKIGKGFPVRRLVGCPADGDELPVAKFGREDRAPEPLLALADELLGGMPIGCRGKRYAFWRLMRGRRRDRPAAAFVLSAAATGAGMVASRYHGWHSYSWRNPATRPDVRDQNAQQANAVFKSRLREDALADMAIIRRDRKIGTPSPPTASGHVLSLGFNPRERLR
jgi:hypothetical protein